MSLTMKLMLPVIVVSLVVTVSGTETQRDYKDCATSLSTLEEALYNTSDNKVRLNAYFFPPREEFVPYAKVVYTFDNENETTDPLETESCEVTYVWAIGGFLLIQPPSIFTYSSLFFFHVRHSGDFTLHLTLPHACKPLVDVEKDNRTCSCANKEDNPLDLLTQQIRLYAKYSSPAKIEIGTNVLTQAECYDNLDRDYLRSVNTRVYLSYCLCLPLIVITALIVVVRSLRVPITAKLSNSLNHPSVAGLVLTGIFLHMFCLAMDMAAVCYMYLGRELKDIPANANVHRSLNFFATGITLGINIIISVLLIVCSAYLHCQHILQPDGCLFKYGFRRVFSPLFYVVFGEFDQEDYWNSTYKEETNHTGAEKKRIRQHTAWVVSFMLLAPLFSLASHVGYIFAAWLTEPSKATSVALIFLGVTVFLFVMFRQCYMTNKAVQVQEKWKNSFILCYPFIQILKCTCNCICLCVCMKAYWKIATQQPKKKASESLLEEEEPDTPEDEETKDQKKRQDQVQVMLEPIEVILKDQLKVDHFFNTRAFCIAFAWGWPLLGSIAFLLSAFYELPVASYTLPLYLLNAFQVFIVIITLLITYKILQITDPALHVFLRTMKEAYTERAQRFKVPEDSKVKMEGDEVVSTGTLIGELAEVIVHELHKSTATKDLVNQSPTPTGLRNTTKAEVYPHPS